MRAFEFLKEDDFEGSVRLPGEDRELKITIPVTINMDGQQGGDVDIPSGSGQPGRVNTTIAAPATKDFPTDPLWIPPGQQSLELAKQQGGKVSPVINQIVKSDNGPDSDPDDGVFAELDDDADDANRSVYSADALKSGY
jgi:hypothetical protein